MLQYSIEMHGVENTSWLQQAAGYGDEFMLMYFREKQKHGLFSYV